MERKTLRDEIEDEFVDVTNAMLAVRTAIFWLAEAYGEDCAKIGVPMRERTATEFRGYILRAANSLRNSH